MTYRQFDIFVVAILVCTTFVPAFAHHETDIMQNEQTIRICMYGDDQVYCEKIFGTIENTEWVILWFYNVPNWHSIFSDYYKNGWITEKEYVDVLEFGLNHAFEYSDQKDHNMYQPFVPLDFNDLETMRQTYYMIHWEEIKESNNFDMYWRGSPYY